MKKGKQDKKLYIITALLVFIIFLFIFISKGIFPFGKNSLIWGDMHDQITAFYYHFYDAFYGDTSLLVDFTTSGGVNFFGILTYYILSPITFLLLLFPRENIYLAVSIVVALKILVSSLTCLYFIRYYFKKLPSALSVFLSICYAFSGYSLSMYQITPWIDTMYLFPLLMVGLKKVLDLEKPTWYICVFSICLICNFYLSIMIALFILLSAYLYLLVYKNKEERKKGILALGISTVLSLLISLFVLIPSYMQISVSSRLGLNLEEMFNSKAGPLTDKLSFFMFGGVVYLGIIFLLKNYKKDQKFLLWYISTSLIVGIPLLIEPVNKFWHFGSYAFFPYRFGFITIFLLIIGACYGYSLEEATLKKKKMVRIDRKFLSFLITAISCFLIIYLTNFYYADFQMALSRLTISTDHSLLWFLAASTFLAIFTCTIIYLCTSSWNRIRICCIALITLVHIMSNSLLYFGIDFNQDKLMGQYQDLVEISKTYRLNDYYRVKNMTSGFMMNSGMVMKYHTLDHFTSLTDRNNLQSLKRLGYSSMWVKTFSKGGTLFSDAILANKYIISRSQVENPYYKFVDTYGSLQFYELLKTPSYGYFIEKNQNIDILDKSNSFEIQNLMYQMIQKTKKNIFTVYDNWQLNNIETEEKDGKTIYQIVDEDAYNYIEQTISIKNRQVLYLEILKDLDNTINAGIYQKFNIYVNDHLFQKNALTENNNGVIDLGIFDGEDVNIKIELRGDVEVDTLTLATMDLEKYENFLETTNVPLKIKYQRNKVFVEIDSDKRQTLFLPISYNKGYQGMVNKKGVEVEKVFGNFVGIPLEQGRNEIELTFVSPGLKITCFMSLCSLALTIFIIKKKWYFDLVNCKILQTIASICYKILYAVFLVGIYISLTIVFILSYFIYFQF